MEEKKGKFVFFDIETTGTDLSDEIVQIAAVATGGFPKLATRGKFEVRIKPTPNGVSKIDVLKQTGFPHVYDEARWSNAVDIYDGLKAFQGFLMKHTSVPFTSSKGWKGHLARGAGYNCDNFDLPMIMKHAKIQRQSVFIPMHMKTLDVMHLAMWINQVYQKGWEDLKLSSLCNFYRIPIEAHDATSDVLATIDLARKLVAEIAEW